MKLKIHFEQCWLKKERLPPKEKWRFKIKKRKEDCKIFPKVFKSLFNTGWCFLA